MTDKNSSPVLVCFYGPESTGKTTMAKMMAEKFNTIWVPEVARELIDSNQFTAEDIVNIGYAQTERILNAAKENHKLIICDTDLITTAIYSEYYLGIIPPILHDLEKQVRFKKYFMFYPDIPWVSDGLRDLGDKREEMMDRFTKALKTRGIVPVPVTGNFEKRTETVEKELQKIMTNL